jgi:hypothetical protein
MINEDQLQHEIEVARRNLDHHNDEWTDAFNNNKPNLPYHEQRIIELQAEIRVLKQLGERFFGWNN